MADYNINAVTRKVSYTGSAGVGPYAFSFEVLTETDLAVYFNATLLTLTTDYTVTINANGTGSITIVTGTNVPTTPDADDTIVIIGARDIERTTDFVTAGDLRASSLNEQLDSAVIFDQQISERVDRAILAPAYDPTGIDMTLPAKADRADKFLTFDSNGDVSTSALSGLSELIVDNVKIDGNTVTTISGDLNLASTSTAVTIKADTFSVKNAAGSETIMTGAADGAVNLYYDNDVVLTTYSGGIDVNDAIKLDTFIHFDSTGLGAANFYIRAVPDVSDPTLQIRDSGGTAIITAHETGRNVTFANSVTIGGNLTVQGTTTTIDSATVQTVDLGDSDEIRLGDSNDYSILYDETWPGLLIKRGSSNVIVNADGEGPLLYYNGTLVAQTNTNGMTLWEATDDALGGPNLVLRRNSSTPADNDVLGQVIFYGESDTSALTTYALINASIVDATNATVSGAFHINVMSSGTQTEIVQVDPDGIDVTGTITASGEISANGGIALGDNDVATFGDGDDLQIYHDGSNSYISDQGTGNIKILAENFVLKDSTDTNNMIVGVANDAAKLYYNGSEKLATTNTGIDVTGTVTADGLTVDGDVTISNTTPEFFMTDTDTGVDHVLSASSGAGNLILRTDFNNEGSDGSFYINTKTKNRARFHGDGDISFYEDTGTTAKFFWDASAESLGIGTTPTATLHIDSGGTPTSIQLDSDTEASIIFNDKGGSAQQYKIGTSISGNTNNFEIYDETDSRLIATFDGSGNVGIGTSSPVANLEIEDGGTSNGVLLKVTADDSSPYGVVVGNDSFSTTDFDGLSLYTRNTGEAVIRANGTGSKLEFNVQGTQAAFIDSSGNVGIGTSSPSYELDVESSSGDAEVAITGSTTNNAVLKFENVTSGTLCDIYGDNSKNMIFRTNGVSEAMRIDSSGNLLVGTTDTFPAGAGETDAGVAINANGRLITNVASDAHYFSRTGSDGEIIQFRKDGAPVGSIGSEAGSYLYIGHDYTGIYFRTTDTSIRPFYPVTNAESDGIINLGSSGSRFDDIYAVNGTIQTSDANEKQDIEELSDAEQRVAVAAKGLLRKFRWIDAVEEKGDDARIHFGIIAQDLQAAFEAEGLDAGRYAMFISSTWWEAEETYTDDDGIEQTRIKTYDTAEEAPEGAVERTRLGVRYNQLLAFIIAAI